MPRTVKEMHPMVDRFRQPIRNSPLVVSGGSVEQDIRKSVEKSMKKRLGLTGNKKLPADVAALITSASATAAAKAIEMEVFRGAEEAARGFTASDAISKFNVKAKIAEQSLTAIAGSNDVGSILKKRSDMLAAKKKALETAGFTSGEAMQILLGDIAARAH
jgi:hypothetical protein